jgi:lysophospholipase L1-like esterase
LKAKQPVTIVTMGDSLSDKRHWANRSSLWSELLAQQIKATYGSEVNLVNPAMGGTTLSQNLILMPQWACSWPHPDLVTVWFGFNDWDSGVRGPRFKEYLQLAVEHIRRFTGGRANILLLTTCPAHGRWETMKEMEQAVRETAGEKKTGLVDIASEFRLAGDPDTALQKAYWAWDKTHLGTNGHQVVAQIILKVLSKAESGN